MRFFLLIAGIAASVLGAAVLPPSDFEVASISSRWFPYNDCESRKTSSAMVMYFEDKKYNGKWFYFDYTGFELRDYADESVAHSIPSRTVPLFPSRPPLFLSSSQLHPSTLILRLSKSHNFISSIKLRPLEDGRKWGCILYADPNCTGRRDKGEAMYTNESRDRLDEWNDKTQSIKCFIE